MYDLYAGEVGVDEYRNGVRKRIDTGWLVRRLEEACEKSSIRRAGIQNPDQPSILFCKSQSMKAAHGMPSSRPRIQIRYRHTANCSLSLLLFLYLG